MMQPKIQRILPTTLILTTGLLAMLTTGAEAALTMNGLMFNAIRFNGIESSHLPLQLDPTSSNLQSRSLRIEDGQLILQIDRSHP